MRDQRRRLTYRNSPPPEDERDFKAKRKAVEVTQGTALDSGRESGVSIGRVGNRIQAGTLPTAVMETPVAFEYLKDLIPDVSGKLGVNLEAPEYKSHGLSLQTSYVATRPEEVVNPSGAEPPLTGAAPFRDHRLWVEWGAGTSVLQGEIDTGQGNQMSTSGSNVRAMLVDWSWSRDIGSYSYTKLTTDLVAAATTNPGHGVCTTRVCAPYQVPLDLLAPPTVEEFKRLLAKALNSRDYLV
jgi:hypothetical protein